MMNYAQVTEQIEQLKIGKNKLDTEHVLEDFFKKCEPENFGKIIYIPNTYEKDSIGEYLEAILKEHKYTVGRFTSYAIKRPCGHILLNGKPISQKEFANFGEKVLNLAEKITQEDVVLWVSLYCFADKNCDYIILPGAPGSMVENEPPTKNETHNAELAVHMLKEFGVNLNERTIQKSLQKCKCEGRFELIKSKPYYIADGADNAAATKILMANLQYKFPENPYIFIVGCLRGDYEGVIKESALMAQQIITVTPPGIQSAMPGLELAEKYKMLNPNITNASSMEEAIEIAGILAGKDTVITAFGTTAIIEKYKKILQGKK